jgi:hypothetical protein
MIQALDSYFSHYGFETDSIQPFGFASGNAAIELSFALPLEVSHPVTGDPILLAGRYDMIGEHTDGNLWVVDEKTTGYLGQSWYSQWPLRSQLTAYVAAARAYGYAVSGAIIRGVAIKKTAIDHAESIQYRPDWFVDRWWAQTNRDVARMVEAWREYYFDFNYDASCSNYGGCPFIDVCGARNPERWLPTQFTKRVWDPLRHEETELTI